MWRGGAKLPVGLGSVGARIGNDASHHNGLEHGKRGGKKFIRNQIRKTERRHIEDQISE